MIQVRLVDGMIRQFCRQCEHEYGGQFNPHGPWVRRTAEQMEQVQLARAGARPHAPRAPVF